jgi:hypothetical protein
MQRNRFGRLITHTLIAVAVIVVGVTTAATPSLAATCNWDTCNDKDPQASGCSSGATTIDSRFNGGNTSYTVDLRDGINCTALWTRITLQTCLGGFGNDDWYVDIEETVWTPYGYYPTAEGTAINPWAYCNGGRVWSYMRRYDHSDPNNKYQFCWMHLEHGSAAPGRYDRLSLDGRSTCAFTNNSGDKTDTSYWQHY